MRNPKIRTGLVGYFDILGFQKIMGAETDEQLATTAELVKAHLINFPHILKTISEEIHPSSLMPLTQGCSFADSILLWCEVPPADFEVYFWHAFLQICSRFFQHYFSAGLPLRGAVSAGKFFVEDRCFTGKPILDCHKIASQTEWAGCVVVPGAKKKLQLLWDSPPSAEYKTIMEQVCVQYEVPIKPKQKTKFGDRTSRVTASRALLVLKWSYYNLSQAPDSFGEGIPDVARQTFSAYGKAITLDARRKMQNTIKFLQFVDGLYGNSNSPRKITPQRG